MYKPIMIPFVALGFAFLVSTSALPVFAQNGIALYPDLRSVVPKHVQLVQQQGTEKLRISSGIANTGDGPWAIRPEFHPTTTTAIQEIRDADGAVALEHVAGEYVFHPEHNHWHIGDVASFEVHAGSPDGPLMGDAVKITFCLVDWYKLDGNAPGWERTFFDCETSYQGVSVGWVDQYHHSLEGQSVDITGIPDGEYYLVARVNPTGIFLEKDTTNNAAWVKFHLYQPGKGNRKIEILEQSPCDSPGLCGDIPTNR